MKSIIKKLINKKISISVAESCTGGLLSSTITSISGASTIYNMGLITNNERYNQIIDIWTHTNSRLTNDLMTKLKVLKKH